MLRKTIEPVGDLKKNADGNPEFIIKKMIAEYRFFGILLYRKELINPESYDVEYYKGFTIDF